MTGLMLAPHPGEGGRLAEMLRAELVSTADAPPPVAREKASNGDKAHTSKCCRCCCCCCCLSLRNHRRGRWVNCRALAQDAGAYNAQCCVLGCGWRSLAADDRHAGCGSKQHDQCAR